jgi:hypothetical protein
MGWPSPTRVPTSAIQTTRPAMTVAMRASARLTIEPGIQLSTLTGRTLTVPTSTTGRSAGGGSAALAPVAVAQVATAATSGA